MKPITILQNKHGDRCIELGEQTNTCANHSLTLPVSDEIYGILCYGTNEDQKQLIISNILKNVDFFLKNL